MEIGDRVRIKEDGSEGIVRILEGVPPYKAYVDLEPGAIAGYVYFRIFIAAEERYIKGTPSGPGTLALNPYNVDDLEII